LFMQGLKSTISAGILSYVVPHIEEKKSRITVQIRDELLIFQALMFNLLFTSTFDTFHIAQHVPTSYHVNSGAVWRVIFRLFLCFMFLWLIHSIRVRIITV